MVGRTLSFTQADELRFKMIYEVGCLPSSIKGWPGTQCEVHHLLSGQKRRGHRYTIGLSPWHHQGKVGAFKTIDAATRGLGPSMALNSRAFHEYFGTDDQLLMIQDAAIRMVKSAFKRGEYLPPHEIGRLVVLLWKEIVKGQTPSKV